MTKKSLKISIEEEILEKAKKHIPNLSGFVEECLKHYLGYANGTYPVGNINEITDNIGKLQVELFLIKQNIDDEESKLEVENFEKDKAWRFLWNDYMVRLIPDGGLMDKAIEVLHKETYPQSGFQNARIRDIINLILCEYEGNDLIDTLYRYFYTDLSELYTIDPDDYDVLESGARYTRGSWTENTVFMKTKTGVFYPLNPALTESILLETVKTVLRTIRETVINKAEGDT